MYPHALGHWRNAMTTIATNPRTGIRRRAARCSSLHQGGAGVRETPMSKVLARCPKLSCFMLVCSASCSWRQSGLHEQEIRPPWRGAHGRSSLLLQTHFAASLLGLLARWVQQDGDWFDDCSGANVSGSPQSRETRRNSSEDGSFQLNLCSPLIEMSLHHGTQHHEVPTSLLPTWART